MRFLIFFMVIACFLSTLKAWIDVDDFYYDKDLATMSNEVRFKTDEALRMAKVVVKERFTGNQSQDVMNDIAEILNKARNTLEKVEKWIKENNATGELIKSVENCVLNILEETTDETLDYLAKLENLCWNKYDWDVPIQSVISNMTDLVDEGKNLYPEFLEDLTDCTEDDHYIPECVAVAYEWAHAKAEELLHVTFSYMDLLLSIDQEYESNGRMCQNVIKERINWISVNVIDGLQECKRKKT